MLNKTQRETIKFRIFVGINNKLNLSSMKNIIYILVLILSMSSVQSAFAQNVLITNVGQSNEPSIMMDYNNPNILVAGANLNYVYNSSDGGLTWKLKTLNSTYGVWGDPAINVDTEGNFYFFHLF